MKSLFILFVGLIGGAAAVFLWSSSMMNEHFAQSVTRSNADSRGDTQPLYWVAPMDDSYRRDKPGKSPMGMDLVPVYGESRDGNNSDDGNLGEVSILPQVQQNMGVKFTTVKRGKLDLTFNTVGNVSYNEDYLVHIHPRVEGWIDTLYIKTEGEAVSKGQKLYTLYSPALVTAQEEFVIALKRGDTHLAAGAKQRLKALHLSDEFITELEKKREVAQTVTFFAPQNGVVEHLGVREGYYVQPGTTVLSIAGLDSVWIEARVFEHDVPNVALGQQVDINFDYLPSKAFSGKVDFIYPVLNAETRTLKVRITLANDKGEIKPNMFASVTFSKQTEQPVLYVPYQSVIQTSSDFHAIAQPQVPAQSQAQPKSSANDKGQHRVVVKLDNSFKSIAVDIGRKSGAFIEVTKGLKEGDKVVVSAQFLIDSESSKTSDFKRMQSYTEYQTLGHEKGAHYKAEHAEAGHDKAEHGMSKHNMPADHKSAHQMPMNSDAENSKDMRQNDMHKKDMHHEGMHHD
ncbi:efflux RND transporter periplasmic adaptor subunit [Alteromonas sp. 1_MG-2023]|uniref:efflux RND transporter periplasmic adaptor subunit n=1 Tax=Alteromonas sp. 1_MG-2023 TaxID=3062669 RepID=UPI0026E2C50F|nr:efflux RND transporter periplasmic adaptor subunit [Alteromonas sp. 1_MG-2023]MDO6568332.1 efflux RND transporter periplasmic adaptor subunit [Alteromonas sp. 1_MG-2023]